MNSTNYWRNFQPTKRIKISNKQSVYYLNNKYILNTHSYGYV